MDLVKPTLIGIGMTVLGLVVSTIVVWPALSRAGAPFGWQLTAAVVTVAAGATLGGGLAARAHREPHRSRPARHLLAAVVGPGLVGLLSAVAVDPGLRGAWLVRLLNLWVPLAAAYTGMRWLDTGR